MASYKIIKKNRCVTYLKNGKRHRDDGPAYWSKDSDYKEWYKEGVLHRDKFPAITRADGYKEWWVKGKRHRIDGPAVIYPNNYVQYWIHGKQYSVVKYIEKLLSENLITLEDAVLMRLEN